MSALRSYFWNISLLFNDGTMYHPLHIFSRIEYLASWDDEMIKVYGMLKKTIHKLFKSTYIQRNLKTGSHLK